LKNYQLTDRDGNVFAILRKEDDKPYLYVQFLGNIKVEEMKRIMSMAADFPDELKCPYILTDRRKSTGNLYELGHFIENKWGPSAAEFGIRCIANITSADASSAFTSKDLESRILGFEFRSFNSFEEADKWLIERSMHTSH
jgi:hypothetical protein